MVLWIYVIITLGMLEFHPSIYDKLYKAAETMNIAVLMKLLAQLQSKNLKIDKKEPTNNLPGSFYLLLFHFNLHYFDKKEILKYNLKKCYFKFS